MGVGGAGGQECLEHGHVQRMQAVGVELDGVARDVQQGRGGGCVADGLAQVGQRLAQVGARRVVGQLGPQQAHQGIALMGAVGLDRQVSQQRPRLVVAESGSHLPVQQNLNGA